MTGCFRTGLKECTGFRGVLAPTFPRAPGAQSSVCRAAISRAAAESGPGCGTNTASR